MRYMSNAVPLPEGNHFYRQLNTINAVANSITGCGGTTITTLNYNTLLLGLGLICICIFLPVDYTVC